MTGITILHPFTSLVADSTNATLVRPSNWNGSHYVSWLTTTVSGLPIAGVRGRRYFVTDATVTTFNSTLVGGGLNNVPVFDDGTNWRIG